MAVTDDRTFAGSIAEIYDRYLVPLIFDSYALDLAWRVVEAKPLDVLETAAGTGVLTRAIASRLPADARIVATDLNQPMLDRAKGRQSQNGRIEWKQADALALPFENQSFDVVACQFGVMFFPEKVQGYREAWRVSSRAVASTSTYGTEFQRMSLLIQSRKRWRQSFRIIPLASWPAPRMATTM